MRYLLLFAMVCSASGAVPLASDRRVPWWPGSTVGVSNGIPTTFSAWSNAVDHGADPTGVANSQPALQSLINSAGTWGRIVTLSTGRFEMGSQISKDSTKGGILFRGAGANIGNMTPAQFATNGTTIISTNGFLLNDSQSFFDFTVDENITIGQSNFNCRPGSDLSPYLGKVARISVANSPNTDPHDVNVINVNSYNGRDINQYVQVVAVAGSLSNVTIWPPAGRIFTNTASVKFGVNTSPVCEFIGFENIRFIGSNDITHSPAASANLISMFGTRNWWFKNCRFENPNGFFINAVGNMFTEIASCDFISSMSGANTAVIISSGSSGDYIYNCYSTGGSPFTEYNNSSCNAVCYNYVTNAVSNDFHVGNPFDNHSPHSWGNIYEGNWGCTYQSDSYFGSSDRLTFHRNYFSGYDMIKVGIPRCIDLGRWSQKANIIGNILGAPPGVSNFYIGNWTLFGTPVYNVTNQFFFDDVPQIYRFGYPYPGNSSYGSGSDALNTPGTDWRYPGPQNKFVISNGTTGPDGTNRLYGDFSLFTDPYIQNAGGVIYFLIQRSVAHGGTNYYYSPCSTTFAGDATSIPITSFIAVTNGDDCYRVGADAYPALTQYSNTFVINGNWDTTNNAVVNATDYFYTNSYVLPSGGAKPVWWTDENGATMPNYPPVTNTLGVTSIYSTNWPAYRRFTFTAAAPTPPVIPEQKPGLGKRIKLHR